MPETIRLRTQVGVDKQINVQLNQDFEQLEILSLKVRADDVYTRMCADYGVVVGRVTANGGYGIPNAKVSVFIPITAEDQNNDITQILYPYSSVEGLNEDGYRYNLLPYEPQYPGHVATGTFPSRNDVLTNPALIEIYDKYYRFTVKTNGSGDYMIMGVPLGSYTIFMDLDLSDIGPFSLSPQDLIRMGRATEDQVDGASFKSSTNLYELPQIVSFSETVNVEPFWGQPEICQINISRHDFDLRTAGITIEPTAIFMGSLLTNNDEESLRTNCRPNKDLGGLCNLSTGPGEIIGIRQTIFNDNDGYPILEQAVLPQGGKVIDEDGTWVMDVPMNLDYVTTNEFGEQILSPDPSVGIPTKGKYRFKIKYTQPVDAEKTVKRAHFLVPNIKEYGWTDSDEDPIYSLDVNSPQYKQLLGSYYFGLDWSGYTNPSAAVACTDTFYEYQYNKVYTVASHIDEWRKGANRKSFIGIKDITNSECISENNRFPATDAIRDANFGYTFLRQFIFPIFTYVFLALIVVLHVLTIVWAIIRPIIAFVYGTLLGIIYVICQAINLFRSNKNQLKCPKPANLANIYGQLTNPFYKFTLPNLSYPNCEPCECSPELIPTDDDEILSIQQASAQNSTSLNADFFLFDSWANDIPEWNETFAGAGEKFFGDSVRVPITKPTKNDYDFINNLPPWEVINKFNLKSKYFDSDVYPGSNRIKTQIEPKYNPNTFHYDNIMAVIVDPDTQTFFKSGQLISFQQPTLSTDPNVSGFTVGNTTGITGKTIEGKTIVVNYADPTNSNTSQSVTYNLNGDPTKVITKNYKFATDIEYFQVITGLTYNEFVSQNAMFQPAVSVCNYIQYTVKRASGAIGPITFDYTLYDGTPGSTVMTTTQVQIVICACENSITSTSPFTIEFQTPCTPPPNTSLVFNDSLYSQLSQPIKLFREDGKEGAELYDNYLSQWNGGEISIIFMVRGVDPQSGRKTIKYDLSRIFGYNNFGTKIVEGSFYLNIPVQPQLQTVNHNELSDNLQINNNGYLYFPSFTYTAGTDYSVYTTTLQSYYSSLDYSQVNKYKINSNDPDTLLTTAMVSKGSSNQLIVNKNTPIGVGYRAGEYIDGGSFIAYLPTGGLNNIKPVNGDNNNGVRPSLYFAPSWASFNTPPFTSKPMVIYSQKLVMRSDRLPVGTIPDTVISDNPDESINNNFAWQASNTLPYTLYDEDGQSETTVTPPSFDYGDPSGIPDNETGGTFNSVANTFTCDNMVNLYCYNGYGTNFSVRPSDNPCNTNSGGNKTVVRGCYVLVNKPIISLFGRNNDFDLYLQWQARYLSTYGICQGLVAQTFVNSWVNGTLFAFPVLTKIGGDNLTFGRKVANSKVTYGYCSDVVVFDPNSNNPYYRSSPWNNVSKQFIGKTGDNQSKHVKNLLYPTTILDMGPKYDWSKYVTLSPNYYGYQMNKLSSTSWNDVSGLNQLLVLSRLTNESFLLQLIPGSTAGNEQFGFFNRNGEEKVDGDYAQMLQINSQYGVTPYDAENYVDDPTNPLNNPVYVGAGNTLGSLFSPVFGIFYSGSSEDRDVISPRRLDRNLTGSTLISDDLGTKSQQVPYYGWVNQTWDNGGLTIFGTRENNWETGEDSRPFFKQNYQSLDRLKTPMFLDSSGLIQNRKGYIFQRNVKGEYIAKNASVPNNQKTIVSAPWYFYFGLKKGRSAIDKFSQTYIGI